MRDEKQTLESDKATIFYLNARYNYAAGGSARESPVSSSIMTVASTLGRRTRWMSAEEP